MTVAEKIEIDGGYIVEIHYDEDACNPLKEFDSSPTLALHTEAERHFGWTTDEDWGYRLNSAIENILERGYTKSLRGPKGALAVISRWMRAFYGIPVVLPVGAGEHSGTWTYLGDTEHWCDPGGWDSGWVGWLFATREQITEWGFRGDDTALEESLRSSFSEFEAWVAGSCYGYIVEHEDGHEIVDDSCWGFYGSNCMDEGGYMREQFMGAVESDGAERADDEGEIAEMAAAESGVALA